MSRDAFFSGVLTGSGALTRQQTSIAASVLLVEAMASLFARAVLCQVAASPACRTVLFSLHIARAKQDADAGSWSRWTPSAHSSAKVSRWKQDLAKCIHTVDSSRGVLRSQSSPFGSWYGNQVSRYTVCLESTGLEALSCSGPAFPHP